MEYNDRIGSFLYCKNDVDSDAFFETPLPLSGDFSVTIAGFVNGKNQYNGIDLILKDGAGGSFAGLAGNGSDAHANDYWLTANYTSLNNLFVELHKRVSSGTRNYAVASISTPDSTFFKIYLHMQRIGSMWSFWYSPNGLLWRKLAESSSHNFTVTHLQLGIRSSSALTPMEGGYDWVRKNWLFL